MRKMRFMPGKSRNPPLSRSAGLSERSEQGPGGLYGASALVCACVNSSAGLKQQKVGEKDALWCEQAK